MIYTKVGIPANKIIREILVAELAAIGFEGFEETSTTLEAWVEKELFSQEVFKEILEQYNIEFSLCVFDEILPQNWNAMWEQSYEPVEIDGIVRIRAPFHPKDASFKYEVLIEPKMSFGTGHHATTGLMIQHMLNLPMAGFDVADLGTGTGVLAIVAKFLEAQNVWACDIDEWSIENSIENFARNQTLDIKMYEGTIDALPANLKGSLDLVLANINRNILVDEFPKYVSLLKKGGKLVISGFYVTDAPLLIDVAQKNGLYFESQLENDEWCAIRFSY